MPEPGTLAYGSGGTLHVSVDTEHYRIDAEDVKHLLFSGQGGAGRAGPRHPGRRGADGQNDDRGARDGELHRQGGGAPHPCRVVHHPARQSPAGRPGEAASAPLFPLIPGMTA